MLAAMLPSDMFKSSPSITYDFVVDSVSASAVVDASSSSAVVSGGAGSSVVVAAGAGVGAGADETTMKHSSLQSLFVKGP